MRLDLRGLIVVLLREACAVCGDEAVVCDVRLLPRLIELRVGVAEVEVDLRVLDHRVRIVLVPRVGRILLLRIVGLQRVDLSLRGQHLQIAAARVRSRLRARERGLRVRHRSRDDRRSFAAGHAVVLLLCVRERQAVVRRAVRGVRVVCVLRGRRDGLLRGVRRIRRVRHRDLQTLRLQRVVEPADTRIERRLVVGIGEIGLELRIREVRVRDVRIVFRRADGRLRAGRLPVVVEPDLQRVLAVARLRHPLRIVRMIGERGQQRVELLVGGVLRVARVRHLAGIVELHAGRHIGLGLLAVQDHVAGVGRHVQLALRGVGRRARLRVVGLRGLAIVGRRFRIAIDQMQHVLRALQRLRCVVVLRLRILDRLLHRFRLVVLDGDVGRRRRILRGHALDQRRRGLDFGVGRFRRIGGERGVDGNRRRDGRIRGPGGRIVLLRRRRRRGRRRDDRIQRFRQEALPVDAQSQSVDQQHARLR
ncbi:hypothetical protein FEP16_02687 [Burkholderia multivorans]|nr:hypothetical protein [Burkholderia multivorans]